MERSYGKTARSIRLPEHADISKGSADYSNGVLRLTFPKRDVPARSRVNIPITEGGSGGTMAIEDGSAAEPSV